MEAIFDKGVKVFVFRAPEGDRRNLVKEKMLEMASVEWTPDRDFSTCWKGVSEFPVGLEYKKGEIYRGVTYSKAHGDLYEFLSFLEKRGGVPVFVPNSPYYEELVGMHCSDCITMAYQHLADFPFKGSLKPNSARGNALSFVRPIIKPEGDQYYCPDVLRINSFNDVMEAYANSNTGDVLFKKKNASSGHSRMVSERPLVFRDGESGLIDPEKSRIKTIEATNEFDVTRKDCVKTTWWIDHEYTFAELYSTFFLPVTFAPLSQKTPLSDAHLFYKGDNGTFDKIKNKLNGKIRTDFPLIFVKADIKDESGRSISYALGYRMMKDYFFDLSSLEFTRSPASLGKGKYVFTLCAGIARGCAELERFDFEII